MQEQKRHENTEAITKLCDYIRENCRSGESMQLPELSRRVGVSPFHFQRTFTKVVGISPKEFVQACRIEALKGNLRGGSTVTDAIYDSGFTSSSRVYERVDSDLGMTPSSYRTGAKGIEISYATIATPMGQILIAATDRGLCSVQIGDTKEALVAQLRAEYPVATLDAVSEPYSELLRHSINALQEYLAHQTTPANLPIDVKATAFQMKVWKYLQAIPAGEVRTYSEVASAIGQPKAVRAVARACASNQVALVIPCHRVIRADGNAGGYRWSLQRKEKLLRGERSGTPASKSIR